ncbi:SCO3374 family protein [Streptomyces sp. MB09-02B]|uniref:SCO3374 family protein n=1 Tax=Streptomyces sp. MB09-02B TaxID=3028667 RepID=UPI0029AFECF6|nr:SCO3374 family protein [Streptomyces sp. MB09-02B]MDX3644368.1 SCO3374 family protein [Streptomyces sp. MB09-02B]
MAIVPLPRRPLDPSASSAVAPRDVPGEGPCDAVRWWYENDLGWATVPGTPVHLITGLRFDVLDVPVEAGIAALRHLGPVPGPGSPVARCGSRMLLLVAAGSAEEVPGLLQWLDWGGLDLDLTAVGTGGHLVAPEPPGGTGRHGGVRGEAGSQGAAEWVRPPEPGCEVEPSLPSMSALGGGGAAPDLVRVVDTVATHCHRVRLRRASTGPSESQPLAFS